MPLAVPIPIIDHTKLRYGIGTNTHAQIDTHIASTSNPHGVTKAQVGLSNVENTALSTWAGSANITTLGTIATGVWHGSSISTTYTDAKVTSVAGRTGAVTLAQADISGLTTASSPVFATVKLSSLTDGYVPYHVSDASGFANSPIYTDGTDVKTSGGLAPRGFATSNTVSSYANQWTRLSSFTITVQYGHAHQILRIIGGASASTARNLRGTVHLRLKQQNALGGAPIVQLELLDANILTTADLKAVTVQNDGSATVVELWARITTTNEYWHFNPVVSAGSGATIVYYNSDGFSAALPAGTQTDAAYGNLYATNINLNGVLAFANSTFNAATIPLSIYSTDATLPYEKLIVMRNNNNQSGVGLRRLGIAFQLSSESTSGESSKMGAITVESELTYSNTPTMKFWTANQAMMSLTYGGLLGIGRTPTTYILEAAGDIYATGSLRSAVATGTAPLVVASTTVCTNLNADLLDGQQGAYYLAASSYTASDVLTKLLTVDGSGSGIDADKLDTYEASAFPRLAAVNTFTQYQNISNFADADASVDCLRFVPTDYGAGKPQLFMKKQGAATFIIGTWDGVTTSTGNINLAAGTVKINGSAVQVAGNYITALTGDVTASGPGSAAATIANNAVSLAKMADMATASLLGRNTAGTGDPEVLSTSTVKTMLAIAQADVSGLTTSSSPVFSTVKLSSLTDGYLPYHVSDSSGLADSAIYQTSGRIMIGTTSDHGLEKLQVAGSGYFSGGIVAAGSGYNMFGTDVNHSSEKLQVAGDIYATGTVTANAFSGNIGAVYDSANLGAATQNVDIPSLDLNNTVAGYRLTFTIKNDSASASVYRLYFNGDYVNAHYYYNSWANARANDAIFIGGTALPSGAVCTGFMYIHIRATGGYFVSTGHNSRIGSDYTTFITHYTTFTASNLTSIRINSDQATGIGINSRIVLTKTY